MPEFQSLASLLRAPAVPPEEPPPPNVTLSSPPSVTLSSPPDVMLSMSKHDPGRSSRASEARLFYAHLREELEDRARALVERIARDVLARELQVAPAAIAAIVERAYREYAAREPLRVRVHPEDAASCNTALLPIFEDSTLTRGDAILELRTGSVDLRLETRLGDVLESEFRS